MRTKFYIFLLLLISTIACSEDTKHNPQTKLQAETQSPAPEQNKEGINSLTETSPDAIILRMETGRKFEMNISTDEELTGKLTDESGKILQKQSLKQNNSVSYDCEIINVDGSGNFAMNITFRRITNAIDAGDLKQQSFDSKSFANIKNVPQDYKIPYSLIGKTYRVMLSPTGKLQKIENLDTLINDVKEQLNPEPANSKQIEAILNKEFDFNKLYNFFSQMFNYIDGKPHKQGDTWNNQYHQDLDKPITVKTKYTLLIDDKFVLSIKTNAELEDAQPDLETKNGAITIKKQAGGTMTGTIKVNRKTGFINETEFTQVLKVNEKQTHRDKPGKVLHSGLTRISKHKVSVKQKK